MSTEFTLNGTPVSVRGDHPHLLAALREELDVTSPKDGCSPSGQCGCCTVLVDGKAVVSCNLGLGQDRRQARRHAGGRRRRRAAPLRRGVRRVRRPAVRVLHPRHRRCGRSRRSTRRAPTSTGRRWRRTSAPTCAAAPATSRSSTPSRRWPRARRSSRRSAPPSARPAPSTRPSELALGDRGYVDDIRVPGMLHAALHLTAHARADVAAIDTAAAAAADGVVGVFTAADIPGELRVGIIHKDWPIMIPVGGRTSYAGDVLAIVVAETRQQARAAAELVEVDYDVLAPVTDPLAAIEPGAELAVWGTDGNVLSRSAYARGDVDGALAASAHTVHEVFQTQRIEHAFLEPESSLAVPSGDGDERQLHVYSGGQGVWDDRDDICRVLDLPTDRVTVELVSNGGAFGGKEDMANQAHAALAAWLLDRPVKCTLSREESFRIHAKRHPIRLEYWAGCDADGVLTAVRVRAVGDSGAYASVGMKVLERAAGHATGPYHVPAVDVEVDRGAHEQPRVRGVPRVRRQPGAVRHGRRARPAGRGRRHHRMGDPQAQRHPPRRAVGAGSGDGRRCRRRRGVPRRDQAGLRRGDRRRQGGRARAGAEERRARQRLPRGVGRRRAVPLRRRPGRGAPRLDGDGPGRAHRRPAGRRPGARHRPGAHRRHRRHDAPARVRPDDGVARHADGRRRGAAGVRRGARRRLPARRRPPRRARRRLDGQDRRPRSPQPDDPRRLRLRRPARRRRPGHPARSSASSPCTTSARR